MARDPEGKLCAQQLQLVHQIQGVDRFIHIYLDYGHLYNCIHIYIYTYIRIYRYTDIQIYKYIYICIYLDKTILRYIALFIYVYDCICTHHQNSARTSRHPGCSTILSRALHVPPKVPRPWQGVHLPTSIESCFNRF